MKSIIADCGQKTLEEMQLFAGTNDANLDIYAREFQTPVILRDHKLVFQDVRDDLCSPLEEAVAACFDVLEQRGVLTPADVRYFCRMAKKGQLVQLEQADMSSVLRTKSGKTIYPRTAGQGILMKQLKEKDIVFAIGAAGTGKTYLAVAYAVSQLKKNAADRIVLTRPAVQAGEELGFLPGDMKEKVDPYLQPLYDALNEMMGQETVEKLLEKGVIEIAPLAFMRGRTLNNAIVILDEAQNTTRAQMKMFLTRLGSRAKMIVTGDITQIDLIRKADSGLLEAAGLLESVDGIGVVRLQESDVVRHPLVQKIIAAYSQVE